MMKKKYDFGDLMSIGEFIDNCISGMFIDYDGYGNYCTADEETNEEVIPSDVFNGKIKLDREYPSIVWYNR